MRFCLKQTPVCQGSRKWDPGGVPNSHFIQPNSLFHAGLEDQGGGHHKRLRQGIHSTFELQATFFVIGSALLLGLLRWIHYIGPMVQRGHRDAWLGQYPDSCITRETMDSVWRGDTILVYMLQVYIYIYAAGFSPGVSM